MHGKKVVVPASPLLRRRVIVACHNEKMSGHVVITKTVDLVSHSFHWEDLRTSVEDYVRHCNACQRHKASTRKHAGLMQPLPIPGRCWESVSMDLIVKLPQTAANHDSILVFVDRLSKMVHLVPTTESLDAIGFARLFVDHVVRLHGMPATLVFDRGPQFNIKFWEHVCKLTGLRRCMSSAYHPQTDGQTKRTNRTLEEMLRSYVAPDRLDWDKHLACAEFAINNSWQESVRNTPFFLNYGQHPLTPASLSLPHIVSKASDFAEGIMKAVAKARASQWPWEGAACKAGTWGCAQASCCWGVRECLHACMRTHTHTRCRHTQSHAPACTVRPLGQAGAWGTRTHAHAHTAHALTHTRTCAVGTQWVMHPLPRTAWPPG